jgi:serine/threonine-protein kinase
VSERGPFRPAAFIESLSTLAGALDSAHAVGIVHGNLKPQNIFVSTDNPRWARITDFCVGRLRSASGTGPAAILGFSAPEAAAGFATPSSDRYALALLTFFAMVGSPWHSVFRGGGGQNTPDSSRPSRVASERAKALGGTLDPVVDAWFARALAADPDARFATATEMVRALGEALFSGPTVEVRARTDVSSLVEMPSSLATLSTEPAPAGDGRMPPVSMPAAGPAYASTLEMDKPDPRLFTTEPVVAPPSSHSVTAPAPSRPPLVLVAVVTAIALIGLLLGVWIWLG